MGIEKGKKGLYEATGSWGGKKGYSELGGGGGGVDERVVIIGEDLKKLKL